MSKRTIVKAEPGYAVLTAVIERNDKLRSIENVAEDAVVAWCVMDDGLVPTTFPITPSRRVNIICADSDYLYPEPDSSNSNVYADCYALRDPQGTHHLSRWRPGVLGRCRARGIRAAVLRPHRTTTDRTEASAGRGLNGEE